MHDRATSDTEPRSRPKRPGPAPAQATGAAGRVLGLQRTLGNTVTADILAAHPVQRMVSEVQGAFGTWTMHQTGPTHPTGNAFLDNHVYVHRQTRANINNPWQSNFAVLEYIDLDTGQTHHLDSFNAGSRAHHSEEVIFWTLNERGTNYRPVALFSDRKPCGGCMGPTIGPAISAKARGFDVPIYYATDYPPGSQAEISAWWQ
ncbi:hypothetical protein [Actinokineospora enzanensis]|uniref:hypothetical protein n=1 Tax=Actinokineospora enzanensis TaxID=155975 RepID=UPI000374362D|nr:hypothetical protein [Actinokineospora enzanensis]